MVIKLDKIFLTTHYNDDDMVKLLNSIDNNGSQLGRLPIFKPKQNDNNNLILAILFNAGGKDLLAGRVSIEDINYINGTGELKVFIATEHNKKGFGYSACKAIIDHAFNQLNLNRIYAGTLENNTGFQKLADKLGMIKEGERKKAVYKNGKYLDVYEYGLIRSVSDGADEAERKGKV